MKKLKFIIIAVIVLFVIIIFLLFQIKGNFFKSKENKSTEINWSSNQLGEIIEEPENPEPNQNNVKKENIKDSFGLEYEYKYFPTYGFATYIPIGWEIKEETSDFIYIKSPTIDGNYDQVEIAIGTTVLENINLRKNAIGITNFIGENLKYHSNGYTFESAIIPDIKKIEIYDTSKKVYIYETKEIYEEYNTKPKDIFTTEGNHFVGLYSSPDITFTLKNNIYSKLNPHCSFYYTMINNSKASFISCIGPTNYELYIDEIATTIAFYIEEYLIIKEDNNYSINMKEKIFEDNDIYLYYPVVDTTGYFSNPLLLSKDPEDPMYNSSILYSLLSSTSTFDNIDLFFENSNIETMLLYNIPLIEKGSSDFNSLLESEEITKEIINHKKTTISGMDAYECEAYITVSSNYNIRNILPFQLPIYIKFYVVNKGSKTYYFGINYVTENRNIAENMIEQFIKNIALK